MKITSKLLFAACLTAATSMSSFASGIAVGVDGTREWLQRSSGVAICNNIEGFINKATLGEVKKADVREMIIQDFAMDYLFKRNLCPESNNRDLYAKGTFTWKLSKYKNLHKIHIVNLIDAYPGDDRKIEGETTKAPYEDNFYHIFGTAPNNLLVTIENINLSKTNLKNVRTIIQNRYTNNIIRIIPEGLKTINVGTTWTEDCSTDRFSFTGSAKTLESVRINNFNALSVKSFVNVCDGCEKLTDFVIKNLNAPNAVSFANMFHECTVLKNFEIDHLNAPNTVGFARMFSECPSLRNCRIGSWYIPNASSSATVDQMFFECPKDLVPEIPNSKDPE